MKKIVRSCMALGAFFVVALVVSACGSSSVPSSDVAVVAGHPISKQALNHWMYVAEKGQSEEEAEEGGSAGPVIVPTDPPNFTNCSEQIRQQYPGYASASASELKSDCKELFSSLSTHVLTFLIEGYWYQASAYKAGIRPTEKQFDQAFEQAKKQEFPTAAEQAAYLSESGETLADIKWNLRVNTIYSKLLKKDIPTITTAMERKYYNAHPSDFGTPASRNIEIIQTNSSAQIDQAQAALKSGKSFAAVAKQYSIATDSKNNGGVMTDVVKDQLETAVSNAIFSAPLNKLEGPIKGSFGYYLVEVTKITPGVQDPFAKEQPEIKSLLQNQLETSAATKLTSSAKKQWGAQTKCAAVYSISLCAGYKAPKTTTTTSPAGSAAGSSVTSTSSSGAGSAAGSSAGSTVSTGSASTTQTTK